MEPTKSKYVFFGTLQINNGDAYYVRGNDGKVKFYDTPQQIYLFSSIVECAKKYVANEKQFLRVEHVDGNIEHISGPVAMFENHLKHRAITMMNKIEVPVNYMIAIRKVTIDRNNTTLEVLPVTNGTSTSISNDVASPIVDEVNALISHNTTIINAKSIIISPFVLLVTIILFLIHFIVSRLVQCIFGFMPRVDVVTTTTTVKANGSNILTSDPATVNTTVAPTTVTTNTAVDVAATNTTVKANDIKATATDPGIVTANGTVSADVLDEYLSKYFFKPLIKALKEDLAKVLHTEKPQPNIAQNNNNSNNINSAQANVIQTYTIPTTTTNNNNVHLNRVWHRRIFLLAPNNPNSTQANINQNNSNSNNNAGLPVGESSRGVVGPALVCLAPNETLLDFPYVFGPAAKSISADERAGKNVLSQPTKNPTNTSNQRTSFVYLEKCDWQVKVKCAKKEVEISVVVIVEPSEWHLYRKFSAMEVNAKIRDAIDNLTKQRNLKAENVEIGNLIETELKKFGVKQCSCHVIKNEQIPTPRKGVPMVLMGIAEIIVGKNL
jgi:hypothetical protein